MVNNVNAQIWLNEKYPIDGVCKRDNDSENKGKTRKDITILDLSKGKVGKKGLLFGEEKNLFGFLKLEGFVNLQTLIISSQQLIDLDVSECKNLRELDCQKNKLNNLNVNGCSKLKKINCDSNTFLEEVDVSNCSEVDEVGSDFSHDAEKRKLVRNLTKTKDNSPLIISAQESDIRNILIIGMTGGGKSTLANVLTNSTGHFKESSASTSVTKNFQSSEVFQWEGKKYRLIDNIGFGDTANISNEDVLFEIGKGIHSAKEGLNQVLFVFKDRFSENQIKAFNLFKTFINETGITKFTTLVRTSFEDFQDSQKCEEDRQALLTQTSQTLREIVDSCNNVVYVDNPPMPVIKEKDNERIRAKKQDKAQESQEKREQSIKIVLKHLAENCPNIYKLKEWDSIYEMVENYKNRKEEIEKSDISNKEEELKKVKSETAKEINKGIKASVGVEVPGLPVGLTAAFEYNTQKKY